MKKQEEYTKLSMRNQRKIDNFMNLFKMAQSKPENFFSLKNHLKFPKLSSKSNYQDKKQTIAAFLTSKNDVDVMQTDQEKVKAMEKSIQNAKSGSVAQDKDQQSMKTTGKMYVNDLWEDQYYKEIGRKAGLRKIHKELVIKKT